MEKLELKNNAKILIVLTGALGDIVRGFSVASAIKKYRPDIKITWVSDDRWVSVFKLNSEIEEVIPFKRDFSGAVQLYKTLSKMHFDAVLDLQRNLKSGVISKFAKADFSIGFNPENTKELNHIFHKSYIKPVSDNISKMIHYQEFVRELGIAHKDGEIIQNCFSNVLEEPARKFISTGNPITVVVGSSWETKNWTNERYKELLIDLKKYGREIVLTGGKGELANTEVILSGLDFPVNNLVGKTSLTELVSVIKCSKVVIGPDSGPAHISSALGIPHITLMGPTSEARVAPWGYEDLCVRASGIPCAPCWKKKCPGMGGICMKGISGSMVDGVVARVLQANA